jgi:hypothetical protein
VAATEAFGHLTVTAAPPLDKNSIISKAVFRFSSLLLDVFHETHLYKVCQNLDMKKTLSNAQTVIVNETLKSLINFQTNN